MRRLVLLGACVSMLALTTPLAAQAQAGTVSGVVRADTTGLPVGGACVSVFDLELAEVASACADDEGRYQLDGIEPGPYKARATAAGYAESWAYNKGSGLAADVLNLPHGLDFVLRQGSATVRGRVTDDTGAPAAGAQVSITDVNQRWWSTVETAADGTYAVTQVRADHYKLHVQYGDRGQWVHQRGDFYSADTVEVADGATVVVDEAVQAYGAVRVVVTDEVSGTPVPTACGSLQGTAPPDRQVCADATGALLFDDLPPNGYYTLSLWDAAGGHWSPDSRNVTVTAGQTVELPVTMRPAAVIRTTVRDAATRAPLADICVETHQVPVVGVIDRDYLFHCSDATGALVIGPIEPGTYQLLAKPLDERYGMQWVGRGGGTGDLRQAKKVTAVLGEPRTITAIRMDPAGTIGGTVTDRGTGAPVNGVCVYPYAVDPRIGFGFGPNCSRDGGRYTITGLGPYDWPVEFASANGQHAWQWSGGAADRFAATPVRVVPGGTVTANAALEPAGLITGRTLNQQGTPAFGYVYTYNARTGDILDWTTSGFSTGQFTVNGLATQRVRIRYLVNVDCWHRDAADFASATRIRVTTGQTTAGVDLGPCLRDP